jgi:type IV secretory pathway TrbD component
MNRPLTVLGAERGLFFVALITGGSVFSMLHSLIGGIGLFLVGVIVARIATKHDVEILRILFNSTKFHRRYDPMKCESSEIVRRCHVQDYQYHQELPARLPQKARS